MKDWSNLAKTVYKRTYSRDNENWPQTVERVIRGNISNVDPKHIEPDEPEKLEKYLSERKAGPAGRGWWYSGSPSHERLGGAALNNCFSGKEKFITSSGVKTFEEANSFESVWTRQGWKSAKIGSFGKQDINLITFVPCNSKGNFYRTNHSVTIEATPNHRWILSDGTETTNIKEGDIVASNPTPSFVDEEYTKGFKHGIIFGDGTKLNTKLNGETWFGIRLCGKSKKYVDLFDVVSWPKTYNNDPYCKLKSYVNLKEFPNNTSPANYIGGFIEGWLVADGNWSKKTPRLSSQHPKALSFLENNAAYGGYILTGYSKNNNITNYGIRKNSLLTFTLSKVSPNLKVKKIETNWKKDTVYCATVPGVGEFTLASGILTGNCWFLVADKPDTFVLAQDLLMLGGGVGLSVEHRFVTQLPHVKPGVSISHTPTKDADFIVPDSREGWNELLRRVLDSYFNSGSGFTFSTILVRGSGEPIRGFGGTSSGPRPLVSCISTICSILSERAGKHIRPIDAADTLCCIADMVVSGNVRRSALILLGDPWDKEYIRSKRFDLGTVPSYRARANFSVVASDVDDLHPSFWKTYEHGEPFGIVNRKALQSFGRFGDNIKDTALGVNPCAEATLEPNEPCNLQEIWLPNLDSELDFFEAARLMHRWGKRVTCERYHHENIEKVVNRNRRVGTGITGCLQSDLFTADRLDGAYSVIELENESYSKQLGIPKSVRTTTIKPSGTLSILGDTTPGIHPGFSRHYIRRVRFSASDSLVPALQEAGHKVSPEQKFDGTLNHDTQVVDFYMETPSGTPCADEDWDTWKQLDTLLFAQEFWSDQAVSVTVYYHKKEIPQIKEWLRENIDRVKSVSFLPLVDHGFAQAPIEAITEDQYNKLITKIKDIDINNVFGGELADSLECEGAVCPVK